MNMHDTVMAMAWFIFIVGLSGITIYSLFSREDE